MQTPPEIEFQGMTALPGIQDAIEKHVAELGLPVRRFGTTSKDHILTHHRDALEFPDGEIVLLTFLEPVQEATDRRGVP